LAVWWYIIAMYTKAYITEFADTGEWILTFGAPLIGATEHDVQISVTEEQAHKILALQESIS